MWTKMKNISMKLLHEALSVLINDPYKNNLLYTLQTFK